MMKNKSKGFTLAEVLVTLGIIGVVAALTTPTIVQHASSSKVGPSFARCVTTVAHGLQLYMQDYEANNLTGADPTITKSPTALFTKLCDYIKMRSGGASGTIYTAIASDTAYIAEDSETNVFTFSDNSALLVPTTECVPSKTNNCKVYFLPVGWKGKDHLAIGEDAFEFAYNNKGDVLILGLDYGTDWTSACADPKSMSPTADRSSCGGRIAANGFKKDF